MPDSSSWQLTLMRSRLNALERKAEQPRPDTARLLGECVRELKNTFDFLEAASQRIEAGEAELKKSREAIRYEQDRFRAILDLLDDAFVVTDLGGTIVETNAAAGRLLNLSARALPGRPLHIFLNGERVEFLNFIKALPEVASGCIERELRLRPRERQFVKVLAKVGIVRDPTGRPVALHWILKPSGTEITEVLMGGVEPPLFVSPE